MCMRILAAAANNKSIHLGTLGGVARGGTLRGGTLVVAPGGGYA